jgi:hypothetical protein
LDIRIRVGAALDANVAGLYRPFVEGAKIARRQIEAELGKPLRGGGGGGGAGGPKRESDEAARAARVAQRELSRQAAEVHRIARIKRAAQEEERRGIERNAAAQRKADAEAAQAARNAEREAIRSANEELRARRAAMAFRRRFERQQAHAAAREDREQESFGRRTSYRAIHHVGGMVRAGSQVAQDIARGAGVKTDIGSIVGGAVELEKRATDLSNAGFMPGATGPAGVRQDPRALMSQATEVANFAAFDPAKVLQGLQAFVAKTGDLQAGRDSLKDMAQLARATGAELEDMVDAAGDVANALGDTDNKGGKVSAIMKVIAGQGKIGAVEIKNLATQMAKLGTSATAFEGDPMENLTMMGALVQMSRAKGGSASATQAATSVASFVNTLRTPARMEAFEAATGEKVYNEKTGMFKNPEEIILKSLEATKGDPAAFKKIFANVQGARAVEGFANTYRQAGGGDAGLAAVRAEFDKFKKIAMAQGEITESFNRSMAGSEARVQLFNNAVASAGGRFTEEVLPKLERLGPVAIDAVDALGKLAVWVSDNPLKAAFAVLGVSIIRAAGEATIRAGIESAIKTGFTAGGAAAGGAGSVLVPAAAGGQPGKGGKFLGPGGAIGAAGAALAIAATAVTIEQVGELVIDRVMNSKDEATSKTQDALTGAAVARANAVATAGKLGGPVDMAKGVMGGVEGMAALGQADPAAIKELQAQQEKLAARIEAAKDAETGVFTTSLTQGTIGRGISAIANYISGGSVGTSLDAQSQMESDKAQLEEMVAQLERNNEVLNRLANGTLNVNVMNIAEAARPQPTGPRVDMSGDYIGFPTP